jgi:PAS domain-containing protein
MTAQERIRQEFYAVQVDKAFDNLPGSVLVNVVNSFILVYVQWQVIDHKVLLSWFAAIVLVSLARHGTYLYRKWKTALDPVKWGHIYTLGLFFAGIAWGSAGILLFPEGSAAHQVIVAFVLGGMVAGATASSASVPHAFYFYCFPTLAPIFFNYLFLFDAQVGNPMSVMIVVFAAFAVGTNRHIHRILRDLIGAQIDLGMEARARKEAEKKTYEYQEFLEAVLYNIEDGIVVCDEEGKLTLFNRAAQNFHGTPLQAMVPGEWSSGFNLYTCDGGTVIRREEAPLYRALRGEHVRNMEMCIIKPDGEKRFLLASGQPLYAGGERKIGAVMSVHDITEEKRAQISLQEAKNGLERQVTARTEELVGVNRELRREIEERRNTEKENLELITRLQEALGKVKTLSGFLPICASCKNIRDDQGYWNRIEEYIEKHSEAEFSHGLCPDCVKKNYPDAYEEIFGRKKKE